VAPQYEQVATPAFKGIAHSGQLFLIDDMMTYKIWGPALTCFGLFSITHCKHQAFDSSFLYLHPTARLGIETGIS